MIDYCSIGKRIKLTRIKLGVLQKDLAEKIGISKPHMSNIETAHTKIGLETLVAIANALNTSVDEFLSDTVSNSILIFGPFKTKIFFISFLSLPTPVMPVALLPAHRYFYDMIVIPAV